MCDVCSENSMIPQVKGDVFKGLFSPGCSWQIVIYDLHKNDIEPPIVLSLDVHSQYIDSVWLCFVWILFRYFYGNTGMG